MLLSIIKLLESSSVFKKGSNKESLKWKIIKILTEVLLFPAQCERYRHFVFLRPLNEIFANNAKNVEIKVVCSNISVFQK